VTQRRIHERWAQLRFSVIGQLLAAPAKGALRSELDKLAAREWRHPATGAPVRFGVSTIERWYYRALKERHDPVAVLRRKRRQDAGQQAAMGEALRQALLAQYAAHKSWSVKLHWDNLVVLAATRPELQSVPSYSTVRRFLEAHGLEKKRRPLTSRLTAGALLAEARLAEREVRSYEAEYVNSLWHWDFHHGSRKVLTPRGEWQTPLLLGILDDRSRLACHLQWYLAETAENVAHGLSQAIQMRGLPRAAMSDNGAAMTAAEITEGLARLGILHQTTLPYSPYQYVSVIYMCSCVADPRDLQGGARTREHITSVLQLAQKLHQCRLSAPRLSGRATSSGRACSQRSRLGLQIDLSVNVGRVDRHVYAIAQIEYCRNFIFKRHFPIHKLFERSCELGLWRLTADKIAEIFGTRLNRRMRGKLATVIDRIELRGPLAHSRFHHRSTKLHRPASKLEAAYHGAEAAIQHIVDCSPRDRRCAIAIVGLYI
jgi:hypothetical protein